MLSTRPTRPRPATPSIHPPGIPHAASHPGGHGRGLRPGRGRYVPYAAGDAALLERSLGLPRPADRSARARSARTRPPPGCCCATASTPVPGSRTAPRSAPTASPATDFCSARHHRDRAERGRRRCRSRSARPRPYGRSPACPGQTIQVKLAAQNTGTLWLKRLVVTDVDPDFFDAVDVTGTVRVNFPPWRTGSRSMSAPPTARPATSSSAPGPPARHRRCRPGWTPPTSADSGSPSRSPTTASPSSRAPTSRSRGRLHRGERVHRRPSAGDPALRPGHRHRPRHRGSRHALRHRVGWLRDDPPGRSSWPTSRTARPPTS